ncbi:MAG: beta-galactosidase [Nocardioides sp.]
MGSSGPQDAAGPRRRGWVLFALVLLALAVASAIPLGRAHQRTEAQQVRPALPVGLNLGRQLVGASGAQVDAAMRDVVELGASWVRVDFAWTDLEPRRGRYDWSTTDRIVAAAAERGVHVLALLTYTPPWARAPGCERFACPPASAAAFAAFAAATVARYAPRGVTSYQLWNEPNIDLFWPRPDPAAYGALVGAAVPAMRAEHAHLRVLLGGLAYTTPAGDGIAPPSFVRRACADRRCDVDAVGYDPYTYPEVPSVTGVTTPWNLLTAGGALRRSVDQVLGTDVPIWVSEFGAPVQRPGERGGRAVSEQQQASIIGTGLTLAWQDLHVGGFFLNAWRDDAGEASPAGRFGLWRADGTARPAVAEVARLLAQPSSAR